MGARVNVALLLTGLVLGCDKKSGHDGAMTDDGGGGAGSPGSPGIGGSSGAGGAGGSTGGAMTVGDAAASDAACVPTEQMVTGTHPDILVVLDASGSMDNDIEEANCDYGCGLMSKWALTTAAVKQVVSATGASVSWGLKFFADQDQTCTVSPGVSVPVSLGNASAISTAIAGRTSANGGVANGGATPTRAAEAAALAYLSNVADSNPKFILLATDGQPNCPASGDTSTDDSAAAIQVVSDAYRAGVPTFVVGIGTLSSTEVVSRRARAGGRSPAGRNDARLLPRVQHRGPRHHPQRAGPDRAQLPDRHRRSRGLEPRRDRRAR